MKNVFWLRKGLLAGRTGPNLNAWNVEDFSRVGFSSILSVNNGEMVNESLIKMAGLDYANIPMSANAPVSPGDQELCVQNLPLAFEFIARNLSKGPLLIHCRSGKDRTGMVLAASLIALEGIGAKQAMDEVVKVRPIAFSAEGWLEFTQRVLTEFEAHQPEICGINWSSKVQKSVS